jgi:hypothetical protein
VGGRSANHSQALLQEAQLPVGVSRRQPHEEEMAMLNERGEADMHEPKRPDTEQYEPPTIEVLGTIEDTLGPANPGVTDIGTFSGI